LVLYVVIFGIQVAIGGKIPKKSEIFTFILKFALVGYFAVGTTSAAVDSQSGLYYFYDALINAMGEFSGMLIQGISEGNGGLCQYSGYASGYEYLSLWDALDCRVSFYLGLTSPVAGGALKALTSNALSGGMFTLIWGAFFSFYFPLVVFIICFGVFLLSVVIYLVHVYIIALITLSIMIFCGPIFIPLALFDRTKKYFDEWLSLTLSYVLYPVVITAFISIMITTFDSVIYNDCTFQSQPLQIGGTSINYWIFSNPVSSTCQNSFGYIISQITSGTASEVVDFAGGLFNFSRLIQGASEMVQLLESMMLCTFFGFLFYYFSKQLSEFAADISGATNLGSQAIAPTAVADAAAKAAQEYASGGSEGGKGAGGGKGDGVSVSGKGDDKKDGVSVSGKGGGAQRSGIEVSGK